MISMPDFAYTDLLPLGPDGTEYREPELVHQHAPLGGSDNWTGIFSMITADKR